MATQISGGSLATADNYTTVAAASVATVTLPKNCIGLLFYNSHATNAAKISLDGGTTYFVVPPASVLPYLPVWHMVSYLVKDGTDSNHATISCLYFVE